MKTILEWLETIPNEDTRAKAIANFNKSGLLDGGNRHSLLSDALRDAFSWCDTLEGIGFWHNVWQLSLDIETEYK